MNRSELLPANVFGRIDDASDTPLDVFRRRFRAVRRQSLFAGFAGGRIDHIAGKGGRLLNLLAGDLRGLCPDGDFAPINIQSTPIPIRAAETGLRAAASRRSPAKLALLSVFWFIAPSPSRRVCPVRPDGV